MRSLALVALLLLTSLAGCLTEEDLRQIPETAQPVDSDADFIESGFEPRINFKSTSVWIEQGDTIELTFDVSDLEDYPYPMDFIDWNLTYSREPNPVAEGDAFALPGNYSRTLFAEAFHGFTFTVDDGQGFKEVVDITIRVGNPSSSDVIGGDEAPALPEGATFDRFFSFNIREGCENCVDNAGLVTGDYDGAGACRGYQTNTKYEDCGWVTVNEASWGFPFSVATTLSGNSGVSAAGDPGSVDVEFRETCARDAPLVEQFIGPGGGSPEEGIIPEGAGCMIGMEYFWPNGGHLMEFSWVEENGPFLGMDERIYAGYSCSAETALGCGPSDCIGWVEQYMAEGCVWWEIPANAVGQPFLVKTHSGSTSPAGGVLGDPDIQILSECSTDAETIATQGNGGSETGIIPPGAGCMWAYEWYGHSSTFFFQVEAAQ